MRYRSINPKLFVSNRRALAKLLPPKSLVTINANDLLPTNADGLLMLRQNADLFYLSGIDQEETILLLSPDAADEKMREILFVRETNDFITTWEGHKVTKEQAQKISGIGRVEWLSAFPTIFRQLMVESEHVYFNTNEHTRAVDQVQTRDLRFIEQTKQTFPLHDYRRLAPLMRKLRVVKSDIEIALIKEACEITRDGFDRVCKLVKPGVSELEIEAEFAHEFIRRGGGFAYNPIIASGKNSCILHYNDNNQICRKGDVLLLDVGASYANYNGDMTRTIPVNGRFTPRQRKVYNAVLRVLRSSIEGAVPGKLHRDWQKEAEQMIEKELCDLGLLTPAEIKKQTREKPAFKKYYMHGLGHPLGLDVHDIMDADARFEDGWVITVEPGIYIREEGFGVRLENDIVVRKNGNVDLMADIPIEAGEIEALIKK